MSWLLEWNEILSKYELSKHFIKIASACFPMFGMLQMLENEI